MPLPGEQTEVVPEQQDRVEALAGTDGAVERSQARVGEPPLPRNLDSKRRRRSRPRTNLIARRSCDHHDRNGAK